MPIPPPPPPPAPPLGQASSPPQLGGGEPSSGRGALLSDICRGTKLKKVAVVNDRSAPLLDSKSPSAAGQTPPTDHPYIRLYQYLHQNQLKQQGSPSEEQQQQQRTVATEQSSTHCLNKPKGATTNGSAAGSPSGSAPPMTGLFPGGVPKLRPVADGSASRSPVARGTAPLPPGHARSPSPPPPPAVGRRGTAPSPPTGSAYNRDKPLPPAPGSTPPLPSKPPPSPGSSRRPPTSGGNPPASPSPSSSSSLAPPPPLYRATNGPAGGDTAPELPHRHNSLGSKRTAPSPTPGGPAPTRGPAPPPPPSPTPHQQGSSRPAPPLRDGSTRGPAPAAPAIQSSRAGGRGEAPPPPPYRTHGSPSLSSDLPARGKPPPPPPTRTPAAPPPPPPPLRNGHHSPSSSSTPRSFVDDFESKYSFHSLDDFPPPDEYRHFAKIYPSKANRVMRGAPPLPPVGR